MPADKNLIFYDNVSLPATSQIATPLLDIGQGGTPVNSPLVVRLFYGAAAVDATMTITVEAAFATGGPWRQVGLTTLDVGAAETKKREAQVRFVTRRRYVRLTTIGAAVTGASAGIEAAARSTPEMSAD